MRWSWEVEPSGALALMRPLVAAVGRHQERRIWAGLERLLESGHLSTAPSAGRPVAVVALLAVLLFLGRHDRSKRTSDGMGTGGAPRPGGR